MKKPSIGVQLAAVSAGNALEFYDFLTFGFFAIQIGQAFFPGRDPTDRLLLALATFGAGFLTRPVGGLVIGALADRHGRKPAMLLSFGLMGVSIVGLALTPSYRSIGVAAPLLAVCFRLLQGFALGGEVGPSSAFLLETAPAHRRGLYVALQFTTQWTAVLGAGLVGLTLSNVMGAAMLADWGWRIAFLIGAAILPFGWLMRARLVESLPLEQEAGPKPRMTAALVQIAGLGLLMLAADTIATYTLNYMTTFGINSLHIPVSRAFGATVAIGLGGMVFNPLGGLLCDRFGRKPLLIGGFGALLAVTLPCFLMMDALRTPLSLIAASALMASLLGLATPAILAALAESLPPRLRAGTMGLVYALGIATFGGTAQFVVTWLIKVSGSALAPAWYMSGALVVGILAMTLMRESAPSKLGA